MARRAQQPECRGEHAVFSMAEVGGERAYTDDVGPTGHRTTPSTIYNPFYTGRPRTPANAPRHTPIDRQEIIRRIKSGGSRPTSPELERSGSHSSLEKRTSPVLGYRSIPAASSTREDAAVDGPPTSTEHVGSQIERPRSALHSGDFRERKPSYTGLDDAAETVREGNAPLLSTSPVPPWHPDFPSRAFGQSWQARRPSPYTQTVLPPPPPPVRPARSRAVSNISLASSFVYQPPTSPLVQASRPDTPEPGADRRSPSPDESRRHTFSPQSFQRLRAGIDHAPTDQNNWQAPQVLRTGTTPPYQAHQPRRSLNSFSGLLQTPMQRVRRPSLSDSPLHHAPMVGSYEESILRGRMSTTPSKPLNFVAQIGVLGKGECKANLRCPPHVTVPFPAVFYSYGCSAKGSIADQPSPYVGLVDLENGLPATHVATDRRRQRRQAAAAGAAAAAAATAVGYEDGRDSPQLGDDNSASDAQARSRKLQKQKRRSGSPKAPVGGSYRIPEQGQIQVVIKNPNKTAVKLFLVPYDLSDMEPGQKTFIRQRSYVAGPIIDMPITARRNLGTDRPEAALSATGDPGDKPMLRYLIHLHICCTSKGRFFLYKSVRVVFANRVPDGKEKLRNEIQFPDPRYSVYKRGRDSNIATNVLRMNTRSDELCDRRPTAVTTTTPPPPPPPPPHLAPPFQFRSETTWSQRKRFLAQSLPLTDSSSAMCVPIQAMPSQVSTLPTVESRPASRQMSDGRNSESDQSHDVMSVSSVTMAAAFTSTVRRDSGSTAGGGQGNIGLRNPPFGYGQQGQPLSFERERSTERYHTGARSESLLSRRLKDLAVRAQEQSERLEFDVVGSQGPFFEPETR